MQPSDLRPDSFSFYPPEARALACTNLSTLQMLPLALLPVLLRSLMDYDWKFPAERREIDEQLQFLASLSSVQRTKLLGGFDTITISPAMAATDWVRSPSAFIEELTASLWSSGQMDHYRRTADDYAIALNGEFPAPPPTRPRLGIVVIGAGVPSASQEVFRKLRPHGLLLTSLHPEQGLSTIQNFVRDRAVPKDQAAQQPLKHWWIDGGSIPPSPGVTSVSYLDLQHPRELLLARIQKAISAGNMGPEQLRSLLATLQPTDIGLSADASQQSVDRFRMSLLTEGAGTQIFATTFVQWAARECLRRAQPETLFVRYLPRQRAQTMETMLSGQAPQTLDPEGSLTDADMGAYYTWLSLQRLTGSDQSRFMAWFENQRQAVLIGPGLPRGTSSDSPLTVAKALSLLQS